MYKPGNVVLVIDDDEINLLVAKSVLESKLKCQVLTVDNAPEGIKIMREQPVSVVLLDIEMPDMDGFAALEEIRREGTLRNVPVIMLTAAADKETVSRLMKLGVEGYIKKPFLPENLAERVARFLRLGKNALTILMADGDNKLLTTLGNWVSSSLPYQVLKANTAMEALETMKRHRVQLLLLAAHLPDWDGFRLLNVLGLKTEPENLRVIMMTETAEEEAQAQEEASPLLSDYIPKPLQREDLLATLVEAARELGDREKPPGSPVAPASQLNCTV